MAGYLSVYTDGACIGNPGPGGWAWASSREKYGSGSSGGKTTNNRMEIMAVLEALRAHPGENLRIHSDSRYVVDCVTKGWHVKWARNGWRTSNRTDVLNRDLWEVLVRELAGRDVQMVWVRGHAGNRMNEFVDRLAGRAATLG